MRMNNQYSPEGASPRSRQAAKLVRVCELPVSMPTVSRRQLDQFVRPDLPRG
jgi:hypothetical protein